MSKIIKNCKKGNEKREEDVKMYKKIFSALFLLIPGFTLFIPNNSVNAMTVDGFTIKKGDIFVTNTTISAGLTGHVAIANGDNHILDIPGVGSYTRQMPTDQWIHTYAANGWVKV